MITIIDESSTQRFLLPVYGRETPACILYVKQLLGHRSINTTLKYVQLVNLPHEEKFICKVATKADEAAELIEAGFEYVTGEYDDGGKLFRKRKVTYLGSPSSSVGSWSSLV